MFAFSYEFTCVIYTSISFTPKVEKTSAIDTLGSWQVIQLRVRIVRQYGVYWGTFEKKTCVIPNVHSTEISFGIQISDAHHHKL